MEKEKFLLQIEQIQIANKYRLMIIREMEIKYKVKRILKYIDVYGESAFF